MYPNNRGTMSASSQFALKWVSFEDNWKSFVGELRGQSEFTDVTLVTGDGQHLNVHRLILSSFSPVLRTMFGQKSSSNTLLFLRGVGSKCLGAILDFMYLGEVNILEEELDEFLAVAEDLKMKGLTSEDSTQANVLTQVTSTRGMEKMGEAKGRTFDINPNKETEYLARNPQNPGIVDDQNPILEHPKLNEEKDTKISANIESCETSNIKMEPNGPVSRQAIEEMFSKLMVKIEGGYSCSECGKQTFGSKHGSSHMKRHIEAKHIPGLEFNCPHCGQTFSTRNSVARHVIRLHSA